MIAMKKPQKHYSLTAVVEKDRDGFFAYVPELQGCYTEGESYEQAMANLKEATRAHLLDRLADKEKLPLESGFIGLAKLEVAI